MPIYTLMQLSPAISGRVGVTVFLTTTMDVEVALKMVYWNRSMGGVYT